MTKLEIDEGQFVTINGVKQWIAMRGEKSVNPVLLIVSGPGVALSAIAPFFSIWERDYTLVHWDQPGAGATYAVDPSGQGSIAIERLVADGIELATIVRAKLDKRKIAVLGISAGSIVGLKMMQKQPDYFSAYVGTGQFVNWAEQDLLSYELLLKTAREEENTAGVQELEQLGPPPYADSSGDGIKSKYHSAMTAAEMEAFPIFSGLMGEALSNPPAHAKYLAPGIKLENPRTLAMAAYEAIRADLLAFDANSLSLHYAMPIFFLQGENDVYSMTSSVQAYAKKIIAPVKTTVLIPGGGHSVMWLREPFLEALNEHVRDEILRC